MNLILFSRDLSLYRLCREILSDITGIHCTISRHDPEFTETDSPTADIFVWDLEAGDSYPVLPTKDSTTHLFLVGRKDLPEFRARTKDAGGNILLKPVTHATLTAFISLAIAGHQQRLSAADSLREDRDEMLQCLMQTNLRLQEYDQDRTAFLARAVHDFRAPLTAVSGYCGLLLSDSLGPLTEDQREVLKRMLHSTHRLSRLSSAMFQLSVGRAVKRRPEFRPASIHACSDQALHEIAPFLEDKAVGIATDMRPCPAALMLEPGQIEQVLVNILHNACKFTPKGGRIHVGGYPFFWERRKNRAYTAAERRERICREANAYRIDICNSGPPIPAEHIESIFEEYTSYAGGSDRSGGGLGLAICRMIVTEHEGRIWAENTPAGPRLSFVLPLPAREAGGKKCIESHQPVAVET
jgi:signal transduction histidine kinase